MATIASHEFGHVLGLNHTANAYTDNGEPELMYPFIDTIASQSIVYASTLDLFALSQIYSWIPSGAFTRPSSSAFVLPAGTGYRQVQPYPDTISSMQDQITSGKSEILLLEVVVSLLVGIVVLIGIALYWRRRTEGPNGVDPNKQED